MAQTTESFPKGKVNENVVIQNNTKYSYALYLPTNYSTERKWAIIYLFDPLARGAFAVERFHQAAEKYNYILVGSNNSRNGLDGEALKEIMKAIWADTHQRLLIDENRVYTGGFSGGSRVASLFAALCQTCIAGVIGSGAGFSSQIKPDTQQKFLFYGAVGIDDYNYPELINLDKTLTTLNLKHHLEIFEGVHQWMPPETAEKALAWLNLQSMKNGRLPVDKQFISEMLAERATETEGFLSAGKIILAERGYRSIVDDFAGLSDISLFTKKITELTNNPDLKNAKKLENEQINQQLRLAAELISLGNNRVRSDEENITNWRMIQSYLGELNKKAESSDEKQRHVARRTLAQVYAGGLESAIFGYEREGKFDLAVVNLELAAEALPKNGYIRFELAKAFALNGQKKLALDKLEEAVRLGFQDDLKQIETEEIFTAWRGDIRFQKLLESIKNRTENFRR